MTIIICAILTSLFSRFFGKKQTAQPTQENLLNTQTEKNLITHVEELCAFAETAWELPPDYFQKWTPNDFNVRAPGSIKHPYEVQSPLHRIMEIRHPAVSQQLRDLLASRLRYINAIAHVLHLQTVESVQLGISKMGEDGYWEPMRATLQFALEANLVGLTQKYTTGFDIYYV